MTPPPLRNFSENSSVYTKTITKFLGFVTQQPNCCAVDLTPKYDLTHMGHWDMASFLLTHFAHNQ